MIKEDLDTPVAVIDLDKMERNIAEMAEVMRQARVKLRPHTKTHKIPAIAHRQLRAGAVGIAVAKTGEAEVMAAAGIEDVFIAYPIIGASKWERLSMLNRQIRLRVSVDSIVGAQGLSDYFARGGERIEVLMKIDTGLGRTGYELRIMNYELRITPPYSPLTTHHSPLTIHHSPFTIHHSPQEESYA